MDQLEPIVKIIALTMGAAWASGINLYTAILVLGLLGRLRRLFSREALDTPYPIETL